MGIGYFAPGPIGAGVLNLVVSFEYPEPGTGLETEWKNFFDWASYALLEATDDKIGLGTIAYAYDGAATKIADIRIGLPGPKVNGGRRGLNFVGSYPVDLPNNTTMQGSPGILVHELGHYAFDLGEEYADGSYGICLQGVPVFPEIDPANTPAGEAAACVMQFSDRNFGLSSGGPAWPAANLGPLISEFCSNLHPDHKHDLDMPHTMQSSSPYYHSGKSCWQVIVQTEPSTGRVWFPDVTMPTGAPAKPDTTTIPGPQPSLLWKPLGTGSRFGLVLDVSGSMIAHNAIAGVRFGAKHWVELEENSGNELAIDTYATNPLQLRGLAPVTSAQVQPLKDAINLLSAGGTPAGVMTNITAALTAARSHVVVDPTDLTGNQAIVCITDGVPTIGGLPDVGDYQALRDQYIHVHTIGFGDEADHELMKKIATETSGSYQYVDAPDYGDPLAEMKIQTALTSLQYKLHSDSGLIARKRFLIPVPVEQLAVEATDRPHPRDADVNLSPIKDFSLSRRATSAGVDVLALVEVGTPKLVCTLHYVADAPADLYLIKPDGTMVDPSDPNVRLVDAPEEPYVIYELTDPPPGEYTMRAMRVLPTGPVWGEAVAYVEHDEVSARVSGASDRYRVGHPLAITAQVRSGSPLTGVDARLWPAEQWGEPYPMSRLAVLVSLVLPLLAVVLAPLLLLVAPLWLGWVAVSVAVIAFLVILAYFTIAWWRWRRRSTRFVELISGSGSYALPPLVFKKDGAYDCYVEFRSTNQTRPVGGGPAVDEFLRLVHLQILVGQWWLART